MTRSRASALGFLVVAWVGLGLGGETMQGAPPRVTISQSVGPPGGQVAVPISVVLPLRAQVTATGTKGGTPVKAETADSSVVVSTGAVISCFFFMH